MEIKTKHSVGDSVFFMEDNNVAESTVSSVTARESFNTYKSIEVEVTYSLLGTGKVFDDTKTFSSKQELLDNL